MRARVRAPGRAWHDLHATNLLVHRRLVEDIERYRDAAELIVLSPPCPVRVQPMDFGQAESLISEHSMRAAGTQGPRSPRTRESRHYDQFAEPSER